MERVRIASAADIGGAARLESAWLAAFGAGDRPPGWFARKLAREHVDDALCRVAIAEGSDPRSPRSWRGFVLVGRPPSLGDWLRTAGTAVLEEARGRGIGRALLAEVLDAAASAGAAGVQLLAEASAISYYERLGFRRVRELCTVAVQACGDRLTASLAVDWDAAAEGLHAPVELHAWTPEAWAGSDDRCTLVLVSPPPRAAGAHVLGRVLVSREGTAWLVHRLLADTQAPLLQVALALRQALPRPSTILLPHLDAVSSITDVLLHQGAAIVQRGALLSCPAASALQPKGAGR